ncbi:MAG TPA: hypothetical protein VIL85_09225 [Thermomicrobiales bacterium]|jgi:hypothetical protein
MGRLSLSSRTKSLALVGLLALTLAVGGAAFVTGGGGSALAAPGTPGAASPSADKQAAQADFYAKLAANLGVSQDTLVAAVRQADLAQIDAALAAGTLTAEQAQVTRDRINSTTSGLPPFGIGGGRGGHNQSGGRGGQQPAGSPAPSGTPATP